MIKGVSPRIQGTVVTIKRRADNPLLPGWKYNPKSNMWERSTSYHNTHVSAGAIMLLSSLQYGHANSGKTIRYLGVGIGYTDPTINDTALEGEVTRKAIDSWDNTYLTGSTPYMIASAAFTAAEAVGDLMEIGLFQELTSTPMFSRALIGRGGIAAATKTDPVVITSVGHGLEDGEYVQFEGVVGMTQLNGNRYCAKVLTDDTFSLYSDEGLTASINGTAFGVFSVGSPDAAAWKIVKPKAANETLSVAYTVHCTPA